MPVQNRKRKTSRIHPKKRRTPHSKKWKSSFIKIFLLVFFTSIIIFFIFINLNKTKVDRIEVVTRNEENVIVASFNFKANDLSLVYIPSDTLVDVSRKLGNWKIQSVWDLGESENIGGELLAETLTYHVKIPVNYWWDESMNNLINRSVLGSFRSIFSVEETNLSFADRFRLFIFSVGLKNDEIHKLDLSETQYLQSKDLKDGSSGYVLTNNIPSKMFLIFSRDFGNKKIIVTQIEDSSNDPFLAEEIGKTLEVIGIKVTSVKKIDNKIEGCEVVGNNQEMLDYLSSVFGCTKMHLKEQGEVDLILRFGKDYAENF